MSSAKAPDYSGKPRRAITVYCWSRTEPGTAQWDEAEKVGRLAAQNGFSVITGGYCGSMEAVSKGAHEVITKDPNYKNKADPQVLGVVVSGVFPDRVKSGNPYLTETYDSTSMLNRIDQLTSLSRYYVVLPGTIGTLQEMVNIWTLKAIHPSGYPKPVILAFRNPWEKCVRGICESVNLPKDQWEMIHFVDTPEEAMEFILNDEKNRSA